MIRDRTATVGIAVAVAVLVAAALQFSGGYYALATGILGGCVAVAAAVLLTLGLAPSRPVRAAASMLVALGTWSIFSTVWGGLPHVSSRFAGLMLVAVSALIVGSALGAHSRAVVGGVLAGITVHTVSVLATVGAGYAPADWFRSRQFEGPIGYHNGEATIFAMGVPLALWVATSQRRWKRVVGSALAVLFLSGALLTQSRGSLVAIAVAVALQLALARRARLAALAMLLAAASVALFLALRPVDRVLIEARPLDDPSFTHYVLLALLLALSIGALSLISLPPMRLTRRQAYSFAGVGVAIVVVATTIGAVLLALSIGDLRGPVTPESRSPSAAAGDTRLASLSASGRIETWQIALEMSKEKPLAGNGAGSFTRRWDIDRTNRDAYVLQPHSLQMETLAELGLVGLVWLTGAIGGITWGIVRGVRRDRALGAAVAGSLSAFFLVASVDWIHSFAGLVIPAMLMAGAAAGQGRHRVPTAPRTVGYMLVLLVTLGVLAGPAVAQRELDKARAQAQGSPAAASATAASARAWDRWDPAIVRFQGLLAERDGSFLDAAALYHEAATLSSHPWTDSYREAQALQQAGLLDRSRVACRRAIAANPLEAELQRGICGGGVTFGGVTYGGRSLTLKGRTSNGSIANSEIWYLVAPPAGTGTVEVTLSAARTVVAGAISFEGAHQSAPLGAYSGSVGNTSTPSGTVTSVSGEIAVDALSLKWAGNRTALAGAGQTESWSRFARSSTSGIIGGASTEPGAASTTMNWTLNAADVWAHSLVTVKPAASGRGSAPPDGGISVNAASSAASSGSVSSLSWSHTSSGADRLLVVAVSLRLKPDGR